MDDAVAIEVAVEDLQAFLKTTTDALAISQHTRQLQTNSALPMEGAWLLLCYCGCALLSMAVMLLPLCRQRCGLVVHLLLTAFWSPCLAHRPRADRVRVYYKAAATGRIMLQSNDPVFLSPLATILSDVDGDSRKVRQFQLSLLEAVEHHVGVQTPALLPVTPVVIKNLYDNDIVDEVCVVLLLVETGRVRGLSAVTCSGVCAFCRLTTGNDLGVVRHANADALRRCTSACAGGAHCLGAASVRRRGRRR